MRLVDHFVIYGSADYGAVSLTGRAELLLTHGLIAGSRTSLCQCLGYFFGNELQEAVKHGAGG